MSTAAAPRIPSYFQQVKHTAVTSTTPVEAPRGPVNLLLWLVREYELFTDGLSGPYVVELVSRDAAAQPTAAERLIDFKEASGLTWDQVSRLFGVSKRAVLLWKAGGGMSAPHEERLAQLGAQLAELDAGAADEPRARLLTVRDGMAPYQRWLEQVRRPDSQRAWIDRQPEK